MQLRRRDGGFLGHWWWTVDRSILFAVTALMFIGAVLVTASSPTAAERMHYPVYYFVQRQQLYLMLGFVVMLVVSLFNPQMIRRFAFVGLLGSIILMIVVLLIGNETKGAARWVNIAGMSIQPSEFMKPFFAIVTAWIFAQRDRIIGFPAYRISAVIYVVLVLLLVAQPDLGMTGTITIIWCVQLFLSGLSFVWIFALFLLAVIGSVGAYFAFDHVKQRIDRFLDPQSGDNYQVTKSLEAFQNGGILGKGPGEGEVKLSLPDSHTDFIFAVAGEEFGLLFCLVIISLFLFIIIKGLHRLRHETDLFIILAVAGLVTQFGIQALINMGVAVQLLPAKGMTLPFLSYGGSSVLAMAITMGMLLALTRTRFGARQFKL